jgi:hypothetical protein
MPGLRSCFLRMAATSSAVRVASLFVRISLIAGMTLTIAGLRLEILMGLGFLVAIG